MITAPNYTNRTPEDIISDDVFYDSIGFAYRALSWLDIAKKTKNVCTLLYAAHDTRQSFEYILFENVVLCVGTELGYQEYLKCKGNSTKLHKAINRLNPDYEKLLDFTKAVLSTDPKAPKLISWNQKKILKYMRAVSTYLHWPGQPIETIESTEWVKKGIIEVEKAALYIWENKTTAFSGVSSPEKMPPEILELWEKYKIDEIDLNSVKIRADLASPILKRRKLF